MVSWDNIIKNPRCVDKYTLWVYPKGKDKSQGETYVIRGNQPLATSKVVDVEPCVTYKFELEYFEDEVLFSDDKGTAKIAEFNTGAKALLVSKDKDKFQVGYAFDRRNNVLDFSKASIRFPKSLIKNPSCISFVEAEGREVTRPTPDYHHGTKGAKGAKGAQMAMAGWGRSRSRGSLHGSSGSDSGRYDPGSTGSSGGYHPPGSSSTGGTGYYPGSSYPGYYPGSSSTGGSGSYPGYPSHGGSGSYPGYPSHSGSGSYPGHSSSGGSGSYPGYPSTDGSGSYPGYPSTGRCMCCDFFAYDCRDQCPSSSTGGSGSYPGHSTGGSGSYTPGYPSTGGSGSYPGHHSSTGGSGGYGGQSSYPSGGYRSSYPGSHTSSGGGYRSTGYHEDEDSFARSRRSPRKTTTRRPSLTTTTRRPGMGASVVKGKATPPFYTDMIEVVVDITPCRDYDFKLKIVGSGSTVMGEVPDLRLPSLANMWDYKAPPLHAMFKVQIVNRLNPPNLIVDPKYGIPDECVDDLFMATDLRMMRLENDLNRQLGERERMLAKAKELTDKLEQQRASQLKFQFGCKCDKMLITLNSTEAKAHKKYHEALGYYRYGGEQNGKPYYLKVDGPLFPIGPPSAYR